LSLLALHIQHHINQQEICNRLRFLFWGTNFTYWMPIYSSRCFQERKSASCKKKTWDVAIL